MVVYEIGGDFDHYDTCSIMFADLSGTSVDLNSKDFNPYLYDNNFDGTSKQAEWIPRILTRDNDHPLGDFSFCFNGGAMVMKHAAIEKLRPIMGIFEMLPLSSKDGDYSVVNILTVLDCVDYVNSRYVSLKARATDRYPRILRFEKCSLLPEAIHGHHIFRIINHPKSRLYVDEVFVNEVVKQGITGFAFEQIWASEAE